MIVAVAVLVALTVVLVGLTRQARSSAHTAGDLSAEVWDEAAASKSQLDRLLVRAARPVSVAVAVDKQSNLHRSLTAKMAATGGGLYAGSVEVFMSVQVAALLIAGGILAVLPILPVDVGLLVVLAVLALAIAVWPYNSLHEAAKKRLAQVRVELPEFAELLLMSISSGSGVVAALNFTSSQTKGVVSDEVKHMLVLLQARAGSEKELFAETGNRLGDPAAAAFFNTLYQSYDSGVKIADSLRSQAEQLRLQQHQRKRGELKKLPTKLVFIMALHLLPFLFIVALMPAFFALADL